MSGMSGDFYRIAPGRPGDAGRLPAIELAAAALFPDEDVSPELKTRAISAEEHRRAAEAGLLWVALAAPDAAGGTPGGTPVGFAHVKIVDGEAYVFEIDVHPAHGKRGVGTRLMRAVADWARAQGHPAVTLTTFRHLPWNAPFYAKLGFREIAGADLGPGLREVMAREAEHGLDPAKRVAMRLDLAPASSRPGANRTGPTTR